MSAQLISVSDLNADVAAREVQELYGLSVIARPLAGYSDLTFHLRSADKRELILKIAGPETPLPESEGQNALLRYLENADLPIRTPVPLAGLNGRDLQLLPLAGGSVLSLRLLTFLPGRFWNDAGAQPQLLEPFGEILGRLDDVLQSFDHPGLHRQLSWDLRQVLQLKPLLAAVANPGLRRLIDYFLLQFEAEAADILPSLPHSIIHNDAHRDNVLLQQEDKCPQLAGIIDFGDAVYTCTICEAAVSITYAMMNLADPLPAATAFLRGYHRRRPLQEQELPVLYYLVAARLCCSLLHASQRQAEETATGYVQSSFDGARNLLERWLAIHPLRAEKAFRGACGLPMPQSRPDYAALQEKRTRLLGANLSLAYREPLTIVRGAMQYLLDARGNTFLDCVNNVCHVGHAHPAVVRAAARQMARLNTNTRYLHPYILQYAERLGSTLPGELNVCFFVCSGSEANDLALRMARLYSGNCNVLVIDGAYHGHTEAIIDISPYKYDGKGGAGEVPGTRKTVMPDLYRGPWRRTHPDPAAAYAAAAQEILQEMSGSGGVAAFFAESLPGCGGQIVLPDGYLARVFAATRASGGICVADEVQVGFGRVGSHFWGFETQEVVPDIVTMGKPIGNGHPLAAVVTTPQIAASFANGMEYFNTFGGNPVSCLVGLTVLDIIAEEGLQQQAEEVGNYLKELLQDIRHPLIGEVRGKGLFLGVELVRDHHSLEPASAEAGEVVNRMVKEGILLSTDGPLDNVLKIKPPLVFNRANAGQLAATLRQVLKKL